MRIISEDDIKKEKEEKVQKDINKKGDKEKKETIDDIDDVKDIEKDLKDMPSWFSFLFYGGQIVLVVIFGLMFGITASAIAILFFSAYFVGYLTAAFTTSFEVAQKAKSIGMLTGIIGIILLFVYEGWWGIGGILGYWVLIMLSMGFWEKHAKFKIK